MPTAFEYWAWNFASLFQEEEFPGAKRDLLQLFLLRLISGVQSITAHYPPATFKRYFNAVLADKASSTQNKMPYQ